MSTDFYVTPPNSPRTVKAQTASKPRRVSRVRSGRGKHQFFSTDTLGPNTTSHAPTPNLLLTAKRDCDDELRVIIPLLRRSSTSSPESSDFRIHSFTNLLTDMTNLSLLPLDAGCVQECRRIVEEMRRWQREWVKQKWRQRKEVTRALLSVAAVSRLVEHMQWIGSGTLGDGNNGNTENANAKENGNVKEERPILLPREIEDDSSSSSVSLSLGESEYSADVSSRGGDHFLSYSDDADVSEGSSQCSRRSSIDSVISMESSVQQPKGGTTRARNLQDLEGSSSSSDFSWNSRPSSPLTPVAQPFVSLPPLHPSSTPNSATKLAREKRGMHSARRVAGGGSDSGGRSLVKTALRNNSGVAQKTLEFGSPYGNKKTSKIQFGTPSPRNLVLAFSSNNSSSSSESSLTSEFSSSSSSTTTPPPPPSNLPSDDGKMTMPFPKRRASSLSSPSRIQEALSSLSLKTPSKTKSGTGDDNEDVQVEPRIERQPSLMDKGGYSTLTLAALDLDGGQDCIWTHQHGTSQGNHVRNALNEAEQIVCRLCEDLVPAFHLQDHTRHCSQAQRLNGENRKCQQRLRDTITALQERRERELTKDVMQRCISSEVLDGFIEVCKKAVRVNIDSEAANGKLAELMERVSEIERSSDPSSDGTSPPANSMQRKFGKRISALLVNKIVLVKGKMTIPARARRGRKRRKPLSIKDFEVLKPINKGAFGRVFLARKRKTGDVYALKVLSKCDVIMKNQANYIRNERNIAANTQNPYLVKFYYAFQTKESLFMVMEYMPGGDLYSLLQGMGAFSESMCRIYIAEVVEAVGYLHSAGIIHRDLKPDNLLVTHDGHLKLTDFGLSAYGVLKPNEMSLSHHGSHNSNVKSSSPTRTSLSNSPIASGIWQHQNSGQTTADPVAAAEDGGKVEEVTMTEPQPAMSFVGTPDYLAPEVILGTGHGQEVDWWATGVLLYEFLTEFPPFNDESPAQIFENILEGSINRFNVEFDDDGEKRDVSPEAFDLMRLLLEPDPEVRLGHNGPQEIRNHAFFNDINWKTLLDQPGPFVPKLADSEDTSYFEDFSRLPPDPNFNALAFESEIADATRLKVHRSTSRLNNNNSKKSKAATSPNSALDNVAVKKTSTTAQAESTGTGGNAAKMMHAPPKMNTGSATMQLRSSTRKLHSLMNETSRRVTVGVVSADNGDSRDSDANCGSGKGREKSSLRTAHGSQKETKNSKRNNNGSGNSNENHEFGGEDDDDNHHHGKHRRSSSRKGNSDTMDEDASSDEDAELAEDVETVGSDFLNFSFKNLEHLEALNADLAMDSNIPLGSSARITGDTSPRSTLTESGSHRALRNRPINTLSSSTSSIDGGLTFSSNRSSKRNSLSKRASCRILRRESTINMDSIGEELENIQSFRRRSSN